MKTYGNIKLMPKSRAKLGAPIAKHDPPLTAGPRIGLYHRVSTLDQDPTLADTELRRHVLRLGGHVSLSVTETASGMWNGRPGLQRVLEAARRGEVDAVIVYKLDRFGRSALDVLANIETLSAAGVRFIAATQGLDVKPGGDAMSRLMLTVLAAVAEFERDLIRERTLLGHAKARASGKHLGRPFEEGPTAAKVNALRRTGKSWAEVAKALGCTVGMARRRSALAEP